MKYVVAGFYFAFWYFLGGCAHVEVGPFVPAGAARCASDWDCRDGEVCRFPGVDRPAVCMPVTP